MTTPNTTPTSIGLVLATIGSYYAPIKDATFELYNFTPLEVYADMGVIGVHADTSFISDTDKAFIKAEGWTIEDDVVYIDLGNWADENDDELDQLLDIDRWEAQIFEVENVA